MQNEHKLVETKHGSPQQVDTGQAAGSSCKHLQTLTDGDGAESTALNALEGAVKRGPGGTRRSIQKGRQENSRKKCRVGKDK